MNNQGFSILGVLVSTSLMVVAVYGAETGLNQSTQFNAHQRMLNSGLHVGQSVMESLLLANNSDPRLTPGSHTAFYNDDMTSAPSGGPYSATWVVTSNNPFPSIEKIEVDVSWAESTATRNISLFTYRN